MVATIEGRRTEYVQTGAVADALGVSHFTVLRYVEIGLLPKPLRHPVSKRRYWPKDEALATAIERLKPRPVER